MTCASAPKEVLIMVKDLRLDLDCPLNQIGRDSPKTSMKLIFGNPKRSANHESFSQHHGSSCISGSVLEAACIAKVRKFDSGMREGVESLLLDCAAQSINKSSGSIQLTTAFCSTIIFPTLVHNITAIIATETSPGPFLRSSLMPCASSRARTLSWPGVSAELNRNLSGSK